MGRQAAEHPEVGHRGGVSSEAGPLPPRSCLPHGGQASEFMSRPVPVGLAVAAGPRGAMGRPACLATALGALTRASGAGERSFLP